MKRKSDEPANETEELCKKPRIDQEHNIPNNILEVVLHLIPLESWNAVSRTCKWFNATLQKRLRVESGMEAQIAFYLRRYIYHCTRKRYSIYIEHLLNLDQFETSLVYPGLMVYEEYSGDYSNTIKLLRIGKTIDSELFLVTLMKIVKAENLEAFTEILNMETDEWNFSSDFPRELLDTIEKKKESDKWTSVMRYHGGDNAIHHLIRLGRKMVQRIQREVLL